MKLQNEFKVVTDKVKSLEKYNNNLQEQVQKYALALTDEKNEKKHYMEKVDSLNEDLNTKVEEYAKDKFSEQKSIMFSSLFSS